jgi:rhamnose transport system permease protein
VAQPDQNSLPLITGGPPLLPTGHAVRHAGLRALSHRAMHWESGLVVMVIAIAVLGEHASSQFLTGTDLFNLSLTSGEVAIMALPMTLIIVSGEIDLSVASMLGLSSALLGFLWSKGWPMLAIFAVIGIVGALAGLLNGLLITRLGLPSLAVTIGTLALYRGIATIVLGANSVSDFPARYTNIGVFPVLHTGLPFSAVCFIVLAVIYGIVLHATPVGRSVYAMGNSADAALFAGIRVKRIKTTLFVASGVICSFAGALLTFRLSTSVQNNGLGLELEVVAIVLFAGVSIFGGKGTIAGVVLAVLAFAGLQYALLLTSFNQEAFGIVVGALLLASVFIPNAAAILGRFTAALRRRSARRPVRERATP